MQMVQLTLVSHLSSIDIDNRLTASKYLDAAILGRYVRDAVEQVLHGTCLLKYGSCTIGFSNIFVFMAGETYFGHFAARIVVVSISSAIPFAILPITLAEALFNHTNIYLASSSAQFVVYDILHNVGFFLLA